MSLVVSGACAEVAGPAAELVDHRGLRWILVDGDEGREAAEEGRVAERPGKGGVTKTPMRAMERRGLAERLRGRRWVNGNEYLEDDPAFAAADAMLAGDGIEVATPESGPPESQLATAAVTPDLISGADGRRQVRANTVYPNSAVVLLAAPAAALGGRGGGCTATLIGPTTMLTAAHCVHDGTRWRAPRQWAPAVDALDAEPAPLGAWIGCYVVTIPAGWDRARAVDDDVAVIELADELGAPGTCGLRPGDVAGWLGLLAAHDDTLEAAEVAMTGYPVGNGCRCPRDLVHPDGQCESCDWPSLWRGAGKVLPEEDALVHDLDTTSGQSGAALTLLAARGEEGWRAGKIVGIHKGSRDAPSPAGHARRITPGLVAWIARHGVLSW